jgi:NAD-dependent SIR2 family protein deacetylase
MELTDLIQHITLNEPHFMWFLGAGAPRSAGLPTAYNIIWDLKRRYYALHENVDISELDITNEFVRKKIQLYMDNRAFPKEDAAEEYSFYFEKIFGTNYDEQRQYLKRQLIDQQYQPNIGYRILSALLKINKTKLVFTTNFDNMLETAYSNITSSHLNCYNLEGSEAAVNALTDSSFPFCVKLHGDFQYKSIKNLEKDLKNNDEELEKCFISAATRFGVIVTGYSGRDENVMMMFNKALDGVNPFPRGLFWTTSSKNNCLLSVKQLIEKAQAKGVQAEIVEVNTFDDLLIRLWKQTEDKPKELTDKIQIKQLQEQEQVINLSKEYNFPLIRLNAFPIIKLPSTCLKICNSKFKTFQELQIKAKAVKTSAIFTKTASVLAWGDENNIKKVISEISEVKVENLSEDLIRSSTLLNNFVYRALAYGLSKNLPLIIRQRKNNFYLIVDYKSKEIAKLSELKKITKELGGFNKYSWSECIEIKLDYRNDQFWLVITPDIWVEPYDKRTEMTDFIINRKKRRYNPMYNQLLDAWKNLLFGKDIKSSVKIRPYDFDDDIANPCFVISPITAFSGRLK